MAIGVLLGEPFGRLKNHLVHGLIAAINESAHAAGCGVRELMADARVGRLRTVRPQVISTRVLSVKVTKGAEGQLLLMQHHREGLYICACLRLCFHLM